MWRHCQTKNVNNPNELLSRIESPFPFLRKKCWFRASVKMVNTCAVAICPSPQDVSYHRFPKDPELLKVWVIRCRRKDEINVKNAKVCALHFTEEDFQRDLKSELLGCKPRPSLKPNSVPSKLLCPGELLRSFLDFPYLVSFQSLVLYEYFTSQLHWIKSYWMLCIWVKKWLHII